MLYELNKERIGATTFEVNEVTDGLICSIADFLEMNSNKLIFFTQIYGFSWIDDPFIIGATEDQIIRIKDLKKLLWEIDD